MLIIDCNNLWYAAMIQGEPLNGISRTELVRVLDIYARRSGQQIVAVLDGHRPRGAAASAEDYGGCRRVYAESRPADDVIAALVAESSEPRRLTVVSSDRDLIRAVRKRRVRVIESPVFAARMEGWLNRPVSRGGAEPASKRFGLGGSGHSINQWLRYFDLTTGKTDIIAGVRAGSESGESSQRPVKSEASPSPVVANSSEAELSRIFKDVQPLKRRSRRRRQ
ncbi:MAG: NYN domain-containing protein [Phycisphaerae bacterium]|nr:NYN domain-containing protein [Phycisphaerae bacterium]